MPKGLRKRTSAPAPSEPVPARAVASRHSHGGKLVALADLRALVERHRRMTARRTATWRYVAAQLAPAARSADPVYVALVMRIAPSIEGVECQPK